MKSLFKRLFKSEGFRRFICLAAAWIIRVIYYTSRRRFHIPEASLQYIRGQATCIYCFWHGRMLLMPFLSSPKRRMHVLISTHRDGEMIARTMHHFGFATIRGSSTRGGAAAAKQCVRTLRKGENVAFTPDGPKGPLMQIQPGVVVVAQMAKVPVIPMTFSSTRHKRMRSWDRFLLALPFGTAHFCVGEPMWNPTAEALEKEMVRLVGEADIKAGIA